MVVQRAVQTKHIKITDNAMNALWMGGGTSSDPITDSQAGKNNLGFWFKALATTGDTRGMYLRQYFAGAGGSGEAARIFGTVDNVTAATGGTVNGAHISLSVSGASGDVSGAGNALRATLGYDGDNASPGGTVSAIQVDSDIAAGVTPQTHCYWMRFTNSGSVAMPNLFQVPNAANGTVFAAHTTDAMSHSLRCKSADGTVFYIMATTTASNRS